MRAAGGMIGVLLAAMPLLVAACGDGATPPRREARLVVVETEHAGRFRFDVSGSVLAPGDQTEKVSFEIVDAQTNERFASLESDHHSRPVFRYLPPGRYRVQASIVVSLAPGEPESGLASPQSQTTETLSDGVVVETESTYASAELDDDGNCLLNCSTYADNNTQVGCTFDFDTSSCSDVYSLSLADLLSVAQFQNEDIADTYYLCIRAFGAAGSLGDTGFIFYGGGSGGGGGVAQTVTTYSTLASDYSDLYFLLGEDGSSTVVTSADFSSDTSLDVDGVLVLAGGGGGGGQGFIFADGAAGGAGGKASAEEEGVGVFASGDDGDYVDNDTYDLSGQEGNGGGSDATFETSSTSISDAVSEYATAGDNSAGGDAGASGLGGTGDGSWFNATDFSGDFSGAGNGGAGQDSAGTAGGHGGGGAGGGQGGHGNGGGGGGSYASPATLTSSFCDDDYYTTNSSSTGNVSFILSPTD